MRRIYYDMKIFKSEDGLLDIGSKLLSSVGIVFGAWAYFHTIHPVFEKESELQDLRAEALHLSLETEKLNASLNDLRQDRKTLEVSLKASGKELAGLKDQIIAKEQALAEVIANLKTASDTAVLNKLQFYSDKIMSAYLLAVASGKGSSFDVLSLSKVLLETHAPDSNDQYARQAHDYFAMYVQKHNNYEIKGDQVVEFAVSLFFNYKIDLLKQQHLLNR